MALPLVALHDVLSSFKVVCLITWTSRKSTTTSKSLFLTYLAAGVPCAAAVQVSLLTCPNAFPFHSHFHLPHSAQLAIALSPTSMVETIPSRKKGERLFHSNSISSLFLISLLSFFLSVSHSRFDELFELINTLEWLEEVTLLEGSQTWIGFVLSFLLGWDFLFSGRALLRYICNYTT